MTPRNDRAGAAPDDLPEEALRWIVRLHSGTATGHDRQAYAEWRAISKAHEDAALEAEALWADMSDLHVDRSNGLVRPGARPPGLSRRAVLGTVLCMAGAGAMGGAIWKSGAVRRLSADYASETAQPRALELADGSRVLLNGSSAIDVVFDATRRRVLLLEGQAFFEVARDTSRPFEVMVDDVSVVALGTAFDVARNYPDAKAEISVTEHAVRVTAISAFTGTYGSPVNVSEGESVIVNGSGTIGGVRKLDAATVSAWREGMYIAEGRSLAEVVAALSLWHPGMIVISDKALESLKVNAVLDLRDPVGSLNALQGGLPVRVRNISKFFTVISRA